MQLHFLSSRLLLEGFLTDDEGILWYSPRGQKPTLAVPRAMITPVLSLLHSMYGYPEAARTTLLIKEKFSWAILRRDVREYLLSLGCRRRKMANGRKVWVLPTRCLKPWEMLQRDIQDLHKVSAAGNRYLLVVMERARKYFLLFAYPLQTKGAVEVEQEAFGTDVDIWR